MTRGASILLLSCLLLPAAYPGGAGAQDNSCLFAFDGECDEGNICQPGTDADDCSAAAEPDQTCAGQDDDGCEEAEQATKPAAPEPTPIEPSPAQPSPVQPTLEPAPQQRQPVPTQAAEGEPQGLYLMQIYWIATRSLEHDAYLFQDGQVATSPAGDINHFDFSAARAASPDSVGSYEISGSTMAITWANGQRQESAMEWNGPCFYWDTRSFCPAKPFGVASLDGSYSGGSSISTSFGSAMNAQTYVFKPDGSYRLESAGSMTTETDNTEPDELVVSGGSTGGDSGRYRIDGLTLTLFPEDGEHRSMTAFPFSDEGDPARPDRIFLGGTMLKRQG